MGGCCESESNGRSSKDNNMEAGRGRYDDDDLGSRSISSKEDQFLGGTTLTGYNDGPYEPIEDPTIDGVINWMRMAEFSSMLPSHVKRKLWNGVFKIESDYNEDETVNIKQILKVFTMLHLTRIYKKQNMSIPQEVKDRLPDALEFPALFMNKFLKQNKDEIARKLSTINRMLVAKSLKGAAKPGANQSKYEKQQRNIAKHYAQLAAQELKTEFVESDFTRDAFLQYLIVAFCYETQDWTMQIPFDQKWLNAMEGRDATLVRGYLRKSSNVLQTAKQPFTAVTLYYFHHSYLVRS